MSGQRKETALQNRCRSLSSRIKKPLNPDIRRGTLHAKLDYTYQIHAFRYADNTSVLVPHEALGGRAPFMEYHAKNVHKWKSTAYTTNGVIIQKKTIFFFF